MQSKGLTFAVIAGVLAVAGAFVIGYFGEDKAVPKAIPQSKPVPSPVKQAKAAPSVQTVRSSKPVELSPEEAKRRAERMKEWEAREKERIERRKKREAEREAKRREAEIEQMRREELPDELRYKHRPKLPKDLQRRIDAERELRRIAMMEKRHPERAEEFKKRREELTKTLEALRHGGKPAEKISEVRKNVPEQIKENKQ